MEFKNMFLLGLIFSAVTSYAGGYGIASNEQDAQRYIPQNIELLSQLANDADRFNDPKELCHSLYVAYQSMDALDRRVNSKNDKDRDFAEAMNFLEASQCEGQTIDEAQLEETQVHVLAALDLLELHWRIEVQTSELEP